MSIQRFIRRLIRPLIRRQRWVSFLALCGVLERTITDGLLATYYLKGGVAMELRFAQRTRATKGPRPW